MKEMIQARKEQLQKRGVSGFTLMEMLIVVAIIAVLVAIAIPVFTTQLNKAKYETDVANARSYYAECVTSYMTASDQTAWTAPTYSYGEQLNKDAVTVGTNSDGSPYVTMTSGDASVGPDVNFGKAA